jgi:hypothetical protein
MKQSGSIDSNARILNTVKRGKRYTFQASFHGSGTHLLNTITSTWQKKADLELADARKAEKVARLYGSF